MITKRREDSDSESQPLLSSSNSSTSSFGATARNQYVFLDSPESTDYEDERRTRDKVQQSLNSSTTTATTTVTAYNLKSPLESYMRRPFCFPGRHEPPTLDIYARSEQIYDRVPYFSRMKGILSLSSNSLKNSTDTEYDDVEGPKTHSSLVTIFAIWNTIMGSSLLAMPWGMGRAGLFPGIALNIMVAAICLYTCHILLKINERHGLFGQNIEVSDLCRILLGRWAEVVAKIFSLIVLIGANIVYWVLMCNFLYHSVHFLYGYALKLNDTPLRNDTVICPKETVLNLSTIDTAPLDVIEIRHSGFDEIWDLYSTVPVILALLMFPMLNFKSATFFTKFNSLGTLSVMYLLLFVAIKSFSWGVNMTDWSTELHLKPTFCALSGMLSLSYFIHNIIISIMRNNRNQENNGRDLSAAFGLVTFTYLFIGVIFYICFPLDKSCLEDNILNNFEKYDTMTIIARILLLFQLFTVFPLISYMLRMDVFNNLSMAFSSFSDEFSYVKVIAVNAVVVTVCILFACFLPRIGTLIRYTGALSGLVYIFLLPSLLKMASLRLEGRLTYTRIILHGLVVIFGFLNLASQFFITDK